MVSMILEKFDKMIICEFHMVTGNTRNIFKKKPCLCWENYLSGDKIFDRTGKKGFGMLLKLRCDILPKIVPAQYIHKKGTYPRNLSAKC